MELILAIFVMAIVGGGVFTSAQYDNHNTVKRALGIGKAHRNAAIESKGKSFEESQEISQAQLQKLFDDALEAQRKEQKILSDNWEQEFLELLPDTDPQKNAYNLKKAGIEVLEAEDLYPPNIPYTGEQLSYSERIVTKVTAYVRYSPTDTSDFMATFQKGATIRVYGYVRGRHVGKTDIWYQIKTKSFEGWVWSGSLNSSETKGLSRLELVRPTRGRSDLQAINKARDAAHKAMWHR